MEAEKDKVCEIERVRGREIKIDLGTRENRMLPLDKNALTRIDFVSMHIDFSPRRSIKWEDDKIAFHHHISCYWMEI